jgi:acyl-coenzyme A synthetase/AMP-(fatty) acid ligase
MAHSAKPGTHAFELQTVADATRVTRTPAVDSKAEPEDIAFILRTSGTTARPKLVPVSHRNLAAMAVRLRHWFELPPSDRCLCVMPLCYAQGLKTALFMPLFMGGSLACRARSSGDDFFTWLEELEPIWYSAGSTFHRSALERALLRQHPKAQHSLRFIRPASAHLPNTVQAGLEKVFGVPVFWGSGVGVLWAQRSRAGRCKFDYACRSKARNCWYPMPRRTRVAREDGKLLPPSEVGEIVIQGSIARRCATGFHTPTDKATTRCFRRRHVVSKRGRRDNVISVDWTENRQIVPSVRLLILPKTPALAYFVMPYLL